MSRSFSNTLLYESTLDTITSSNPILHNVVNTLLLPTVRIVEEDCGTLLGKEMQASFSADGLIEVSTGLPITPSRRNTLVSGGTYSVNIRSISTCVSSGGICRTCLASSRPRLTVPAINSLYRIQPEIVLDSISVTTYSSGSDILVDIPYDSSLFDTIYIFHDGLLVDESEYTVSGTQIIFPSSIGTGITLVIKFLVNSNIEYYNWLCNTFAGSLLGIKQIYDNLLPVKRSILLNCIPKDDIESLHTQLKNLDIGEDDIIMYLDNVKDPLEKAIYICVLGSILLNM